jgi:hypothetical protein
MALIPIVVHGNNSYSYIIEDIIKDFVNDFSTIICFLKDPFGHYVNISIGLVIAVETISLCLPKDLEMLIHEKRYEKFETTHIYEK